MKFLQTGIKISAAFMLIQKADALENASPCYYIYKYSIIQFKSKF